MKILNLSFWRFMHSLNPCDEQGAGWGRGVEQASQQGIITLEAMFQKPPKDSRASARRGALNAILPDLGPAPASCGHTTQSWRVNKYFPIYRAKAAWAHVGWCWRGWRCLLGLTEVFLVITLNDDMDGEGWKGWEERLLRYTDKNASDCLLSAIHFPVTVTLYKEYDPILRRAQPSLRHLNEPPRFSKEVSMHFHLSRVLSGGGWVLSSLYKTMSLHFLNTIEFLWLLLVAKFPILSGTHLPLWVQASRDSHSLQHSHQVVAESLIKCFPVGYENFHHNCMGARCPQPLLCWGVCHLLTECQKLTEEGSWPDQPGDGLIQCLPWRVMVGGTLMGPQLYFKAAISWQNQRARVESPHALHQQMNHPSQRA